MLLAALVPSPSGAQRPVTDFVPHPPARQEMTSPSGAYRLVLSTQDGWRSRRAHAELSRGTARVWARELPQEFGPRQALVSDMGIVVCLDEWINIFSRYAVMVIGADGKVRQEWSFEDVEDALGVRLGSLPSNERFGPWMRRPAMLDPRAGRAVVPTVAGIDLWVDLRTVQLSRGR